MLRPTSSGSRQPKIRSAAGIDGLDEAALVQGDDAVDRRCDRRDGALLALSQQLLGALALDDLLAQRRDDGGQLDGSLLDLALEGGVGLEQGALRLHAPAIDHHDRPAPQESPVRVVDGGRAEQDRHGAAVLAQQVERQAVDPANPLEGRELAHEALPAARGEQLDEPAAAHQVVARALQQPELGVVDLDDHAARIEGVEAGGRVVVEVVDVGGQAARGRCVVARRRRCAAAGPAKRRAQDNQTHDREERRHRRLRHPVQDDWARDRLQTSSTSSCSSTGFAT